MKSRLKRKATLKTVFKSSFQIYIEHIFYRFFFWGKHNIMCKLQGYASLQDVVAQCIFYADDHEMGSDLIRLSCLCEGRRGGW